jgi:carbon storage regulator
MTMLVLSRRIGERVQIGDGITVTVVKITSTGVRLGIEAPPRTVIVRQELQGRHGSDADLNSGLRIDAPNSDI